MDATIERHGSRRGSGSAAMRTLLAAVATLATGCSTDADETGHAPRVVPIAALGRMLFFDRALSADGQVSCATCHQPERAYSDGLPHASGVAGKHGTRNTPSLLDVGQQRSLFWDGRRTRLEEQALDPLLNPVEHGLRDPAELLARLRGDARYTVPVLLAYGIPMDQLTVPQVTQALSAFERTLSSAPSPFDRFLAGQPDAMSQSARAGWVVFDQKVHCTRCHVVAGDGQPALFTDHRFHSLAVGFSDVERKLPELTERLVTLRRKRGALGGDVLGDPDIAALGRFVVTLDPRDLGAFKTPGLRNVALTGPYMHDGSVASLAEAVDLEMYARGARDVRPPILTPAERDDLIAFLHALTSDDAPGDAHRGTL